MAARQRRSARSTATEHASSADNIKSTFNAPAERRSRPFKSPQNLRQETGWRFLRKRGTNLIASDSPVAFLDETPTAIMIRQLLGVISEFEKASLVAKLRGARERKKRATGKCEGRKSIAEARRDVVALARKLRRKKPKPTLRAIAAGLAARGHLAGSGKPFEPSVVARIACAG